MRREDEDDEPCAAGEDEAEDDEPRDELVPGVPCEPVRAVPVRRRFGGGEGAGRAAPATAERAGKAGGRGGGGDGRGAAAWVWRPACRVPMCVVGWGGGLVVARLVDDEGDFFFF